VEEQAERPELHMSEMSGFALEHGDVEADTQDVPADTQDAAWAQEQRPATGEPRVDAALARLGELPGRPVTEHRAIFEDVHRRLRDVLGELDTREQNSADQAAAAGAERRAGS
jgi:hypothetical protein